MRIALAASLLWITTPSVSAPDPTEPAMVRQVGRWTMKSKIGGVGPYCTVEATTEGRMFGYQVVKMGQITVAISDPSWRFRPGSFHAVTVSVAGITTWNGHADYVSSVLILRNVQDQAPDFTRALAVDHQIVLNVDGTPTTVDLAGFAQAAAAQAKTAPSSLDQPMAVEAVRVLTRGLRFSQRTMS